MLETSAPAQPREAVLASALMTRQKSSRRAGWNRPGQGPNVQVEELVKNLIFLEI